MKRFAALAIALFIALPAARAEENPDDQYVIIYTLIQQGDASLNSGEQQQALGDYSEALRELEQFKQVNGDWNPTIVNYRLKYLTEKITALAPQVPQTNAPVAAGAPPTPPAPQDLQSQIASLNAQIHQLQTDDATLQAKLKEALSVQPASVSADAFAQMQAQVTALTKENDLLKATAAQAANAAPQTNPQLQQALADQTARANQLTQQNQSLQARVQSLTPDANAAEALREENALLKKEMSAMNAVPAGSNSGMEAVLARANQLTQENQALQARVQSLTTDASDAEALREENALLRKELNDAGSANAATANGDLAAARRQIAQFQADATADWLEKTALENRVKQWQEEAVYSTTGGIAPPAQSDLQSQIRELTLERDNLLAELGEANKKLYGRNQSAAGQIDTLAQQIETLRARVAVDEAQPVPYTPQELALFAPEPVKANPNAEKKSIHALPNGAAVLVAEAQNYYTNGEYEQAAADYQKILQRDENNPLALGNLAAIELEENQLDDADTHIQNALAQNPNDAYNLTILGRVKFSEGKFDDALDALDRAAKLDPQNPQIQNFLGVALAEKGLRAQAENSFRKAILIDPNYGDAHKNLAIIYLSANPPMVELARWHYEKALAAGLPPSPDFEKMLNAQNAASSQ